MKIKIIWEEIHFGSFTVDTEEEADEFLNEPNLDDPRFEWDRDAFDIYTEKLDN